MKTTRVKDVDIPYILQLAMKHIPTMDQKQKRSLVRHKLTHKLSPTANQVLLLNLIRRRRLVTFYESLAMDWRFLGGLFARGLVEWVNTSDGRCIRALNKVN